MNYGRVFNIVGAFTAFLSAILVVPAGVAAAYGEWQDLWAFLLPAAFGVSVGLGLQRWLRSTPRALYRREGLLIVSGCWVAATLVGGLPFLISGMIPSPVDAFFETMSGFTTTGSTILKEIDGLPRGLLFWRSATHWLGGMGIVLLFVAVLPALGVGGRLLYQFEVPGVDKTEDLRPRIRETAVALWRIYLLLSLVEVLVLLVCGLDLYDAVVHTFGTVATGGFSTYGRSISHFDSVAVEVVITVFMFLAGINFTLYDRCRTAGWRAFWRDREFRVYATLVGGSILLCTIMLAVRGTYGWSSRALLDSAFTTVSVATTTGYGTADFDRWPDVLRLWLVLLMFIGGCGGSTAGGMKVFRILLVVKYVALELRRFVRPHRVRSLLVGGVEIPEETLRSVLAFFVVSILLFAGSSMVLACFDPGIDLATATSGVAATLWNIGPGLSAVGPTQNFADMSAPGKVLLTFLMMAGRLEIFTALVIFLPGLYED